jgi:sterol desaturase/sphingolipid hydroxylase (fatty acid hydroxylase superfamily)
MSKALTSRWLTNFGIMVVNHFVLRLAVPVIAVTTAYYSSAGQFGLFNNVEIGFWPEALISLLALDLTGYAVHFVKHKVPWLWRFHQVHHTDTELDFTTNFREHPVEVVLGLFAAVPVIVLLGITPVAVLFYQIFGVVVNILEHANIYLPEWVDRNLRRVFVTPDFHRIHHSSEQAFTDSNYGGVLTCFDFLFGTATTRGFKEQNTMELGLEYYRDRRDSRLDQLLFLPFRTPPARRMSKDTSQEIKGVREY